MFDIHCHLLPGIDDGAASWDECLEMARMASRDGIRTIIVTPHQLGNYHMNRGATIRQLVGDVQARLTAEQIELTLLPGADVRIEPEMINLIQRGEVLTLGDLRKHVLLELPHELYFPLEPLLGQLAQLGMVGVLSHPERNRGILAAPDCIEPLVEAGCLMQVTAGSLTGTFGPAPQELAHDLVRRGLVHFVATDAHGCRARRPLLSKAREIVEDLVGAGPAEELFVNNGQRVSLGQTVPPGRVANVAPPRRRSRVWWRRGAA